MFFLFSHLLIFFFSFRGIQFGVYRKYASIKDWVESEGEDAPDESNVDLDLDLDPDLFRVYTIRCIEWMNAFNAEGHTYEDWRWVYKYWII